MRRPAFCICENKGADQDHKLHICLDNNFNQELGKALSLLEILSLSGDFSHLHDGFFNNLCAEKLQIQVHNVSMGTKFYIHELGHEKTCCIYM